jgi:hypothetical protein
MRRVVRRWTDGPCQADLAGQVSKGSGMDRRFVGRHGLSGGVACRCVGGWYVRREGENLCGHVRWEESGTEWFVRWEEENARGATSQLSGRGLSVWARRALSACWLGGTGQKAGSGSVVRRAWFRHDSGLTCRKVGEPWIVNGVARNGAA